MTEQKTMTPDKKSYHLEVTRPVWLPFNDTAKELVASVVEHLGYPTTGPKADKYAVVIASLLKATQVLLRSTEARLPTYLGVQKRASAWSQFPLVGKIISKKVIDDFLVHFGGQLVEGSVVLLAWASSQGFIGFAIYFALWIFAFPFMLIASIITGLVSGWALTKEERKEKQIQAWRNKNLSNQSAKQTTPSDPEERRKWANRLPPYDH